MQEHTKKKLSAYVQAVAQQNGVENATEMFNVSPNGTQRIIAAIRESNWFLSRINIITVKNQIGEAIGLGVSGMIASRTDTSGDGERKPKDYHGMKAMPYACVQTNFDTAIRYAKLDAWAHMKSFNQIVSKHTREQIDANKITVGWFGKTAAANTDAAANPNGEDVNKGWFQAMREHNPERFITEGAEGSGVIKIGEGGDFANLDLAVLNLKNLLHPACENDSDLVAIIGSDLLAYERPSSTTRTAIPDRKEQDSGAPGHRHLWRPAGRVGSGLPVNGHHGDQLRQPVYLHSGRLGSPHGR